MRKFVMLSVCMLVSTSLTAAWYDDLCMNGCPNVDMTDARCNRGCKPDPWPSPINLDAGIGYRRDRFRWSKAGPFEIPNVLSELRWRDIRIIEYGGSASYVSCRNYAVKAWGDYGHIYHGRNVDADFLGNNKTDLISLSGNKAGKGHVYDVVGGVGYRVTSTCGRFIATPLIGYSDHAQYLRIFHGEQIFNFFNPFFVGPIPGLNSKYKTRWFGPWGGMDFTAQVEKCAYVFGSFEWHILSYRGEGCWNLRSDIGPFFHKSHGFGYLATLGGKWEICGNWSIGVVGAYRNFRSRSGRERYTIFDPFFPTQRNVFRFRFNGAKWHTWSITGLVAWRF
jgi:hypothetical protein